MDASMISPFISAIQNVFSTMFQLPVEVGDPKIKSGQKSTHDVSGIIGVSGEMIGTIVLSMPSDAAVSIVALLTGETFDVESADFADAVGEIVNMISGNAKADFQRRDVSISCPSVVVGSGHTISVPSGTPCVMIPCTTDCGEVVLEVALREASVESPEVTTNAA